MEILFQYYMGGKVPQIYYLSNKTPIPKDYMETLNIIAGASGRKKLKYKVDMASTVIKYFVVDSWVSGIRIIFYGSIRWEFMTEGGDIGFRVCSKNPDGSTVDLIPLSRVESHLVMEEGEIVCVNAGKCNIKLVGL